MAEFPALPLWTDAYLSDTDHLSDAEHGLYLRLLITMWRTPNCRVPNDDAWLARKLRLSLEDVENKLKPIMREFCTSHGAWLYQKRLSKERTYLQKQSKKNSANAKSRWNKEKGICKTGCETDAASHAFGNAPTPTPTPTISKTLGHAATNGTGKTQSVGEAAKAAIEKDFLEFWTEYPKKIAKQAAQKAYAKARRSVPHETIIAGLRRAKPGWRDPKFIPHAATWLNGCRWDDDPSNFDRGWSGIEGVA